MNPKLLLTHFDRISDAPDAIPHLRRFVLDLAVRGKLVVQDPSDETGSELLKRIETEKARMVEKGEIRKQETLPVSEDEEPFEIPANWAWTRLGQIGDWGSGSTPLRGNHDFFGGGITWLKSGELNDNKQLIGSEETVTELAISKGSFRRNQPGDVLIAMYGATIGKVAILAAPAVTNQAVCGCTPSSGIYNFYLFNFLLSQRAQFHSASEGGAQPNISKVKILRFAFPLPPLAEQRRIVAKVDELMVLCDQLELRQAERENRRTTLVTASLHHLNNCKDADTRRKQARFYLGHLSQLTYRREHVRELRQAMLDLAIRGQIVTQDSCDEPSLSTIRRLKPELRGQDTSLKNDAEVELGGRHALPSGWAWIKGKWIADFIDPQPSGLSQSNHY